MLHTPLKIDLTKTIVTRQPRSIVLQVSDLQMTPTMRSEQQNAPFTMTMTGVVERLEYLSRTLQDPPQDLARNIIIAVDGANSALIHHICGQLYRHLRLPGTIRVHMMPHAETQQSTTAWHNHLRLIQNWHAVWSDIHECSSEQATNLAIHIVPMSPLMSSITAARHVPVTDSYSSFQHWAWLANHWRGCIRPKVTINVQNFDPSFVGQEVLKVEGTNMNAILLTAFKDNLESPFSARQIRRMIFEVTEWMRTDE